MKLSVMVAGLKALRYVKTVKLVDIPRLNKLTLRAAFLGTEEVLARNASKLEEVKELKEVIEAEKERRGRKEEERRGGEEEERRGRKEEERRGKEERRGRKEEERRGRKEEERKGRMGKEDCDC